MKNIIIITIFLCACAQSEKLKQNDSNFEVRTESKVANDAGEKETINNTYQSPVSLIGHFKKRGYKTDTLQLLNAKVFKAAFEFHDYQYHDVVELKSSTIEEGNFLRIPVDSTEERYLCKDYFYNYESYDDLILTREVWLDKNQVNEYVNNPIFEKLYFHYEKNLYQIGFKRNGINDSLWFINFEDYPFPKLEIYRDTEPLIGKIKFELFDDKDRPWVKGDLVTKHAIISNQKYDSLGWFSINYYDINKVFMYKFYPAQFSYHGESDSLLVILNEYAIKGKEPNNESAYLHWNTEEMKKIDNLDSLKNVLKSR